MEPPRVESPIIESSDEDDAHAPSNVVAPVDLKNTPSASGEDIDLSFGAAASMDINVLPPCSEPSSRAPSPSSISSPPPQPQQGTSARKFLANRIPDLQSQPPEDWREGLEQLRVAGEGGAESWIQYLTWSWGKSDAQWQEAKRELFDLRRCMSLKVHSVVRP